MYRKQHVTRLGDNGDSRLLLLGRALFKLLVAANRGNIAATFGVRRVLSARIRSENNDLSSPPEVYQGVRLLRAKGWTRNGCISYSFDSGYLNMGPR